MALQAKFTLSNPNPQINQPITVANTSTDATSYVWKLNGSVITQAQIDAGLTFGSNGTKTLELTASNGGSNSVYTRSFYVGDLVGSTSVAAGATSQYPESGITSPKYSTDFGTISNTGLFTAPNSAGTANLKAREELWTSLGAASSTVSNPNNSLTYGTYSGSDFLEPNIWLKNDGDFVEFTIMSVPNPGLTYARILGSATWLTVYFSGLIVDSSGDLIGSFTPVAGKFIKIEQLGNNYKIFYDEVLKATTVAAPPALADAVKGNYFRFIVESLTAGTVIPKPNFLSSTVPEKLSTKTVNVFVPPPADVTGLVVNANRNLDSNAAAGATSYQTQRRIDGGNWVTLTSTAKAFTDNENLPSAVGSYFIEYQRKGYNGAYSPNWSNIASLTYKVFAPPVFITNSVLPYAQTDKTYEIEIKVADQAGEGTHLLLNAGNLPGNRFVAGNVMILPVVGNDQYSFTWRYTPIAGAAIERTFTIPVSPYAMWKYQYSRPLAIRKIKKFRKWKPDVGKGSVMKDAATKLAFDLTVIAYGQAKVEAIRAFIEEHDAEKIFLFRRDDGTILECYFEMEDDETESEIMAHVSTFQLKVREA